MGLSKGGEPLISHMNKTTQIILALLKEQSNYVSGEAICRKLEISRTAVWKHIKQLRDNGYLIESASKKGYRLTSSTETPVDAEVKSHLSTTVIGQNIIYVKETGSTNTDVMESAKQGVEEGLVLIAETQTAGHGRMTRKWFSPPGCNLYFSMLLRPQVLPYKAPQLALMTAAALYSAISRHLPDNEIGIKWPNDLFIDGRKFCGILCEMQTEMSMIHHVVIGIGINVNWDLKDLPDEITQIATSLKHHTGKPVNRAVLLADILNTFEKYYHQWLTEGLTPFLPILDEASILKGKQVVIQLLRNEIEGTVTGVHEDGSLLLKLNDGNIQKVPSGEVHIKSF